MGRRLAYACIFAGHFWDGGLLEGVGIFGGGLLGNATSSCGHLLIDRLSTIFVITSSSVSRALLLLLLLLLLLPSLSLRSSLLRTLRLTLTPRTSTSDDPVSGRAGGAADADADVDARARPVGALGAVGAPDLPSACHWLTSSSAPLEISALDNLAPERRPPRE